MKRILVIDDAATVRLYHREILEQAGFAVTEAVNGLEALEKLETGPPFDLYLVDINMPKLDGYGFLRALRKKDIPQAPAIMISTESSPSDRADALMAGANLYIIKPIKPDQLLPLVRGLLGEERQP
ncbi:two-component system, chemotaxis family, response regulator CheY [Ectothiorhodospira magna]|uniref:Two-component system, chemotaxis family, response regulator CheY n=1 Tax=Ectothiorhodospira magna TaxID=867345 RepID=A0A1H9ARZ4_9GAMM|nr:response regulator [Ectothiorhodospira magna]SEP79419.1 two-component system, chemotaxis family, response regulator CheY [Ectothiorhodospira magna]